MSPLDTALRLAAGNIPVFPCLASKAPLTKRGLHDASTDQTKLRAMFASPAAVLVGVPTGHKFDVLDIDSPKHPEAAEWLAANRARLPFTREHETQSGGLHVLLRPDSRLRNSAGKLALGVDTRCRGGYIVWWPGQELPVRNPNMLAPWPAWLLELLLPKPPAPRAIRAFPGAGDRGERYAQEALLNAAKRVSSAANGGRNHTLNRETYSVARLIGEGLLTTVQVSEYMAAAAEMAGLGERETTATINSALHAAGAL